RRRGALRERRRHRRATQRRRAERAPDLAVAALRVRAPHERPRQSAACDAAHGIARRPVVGTDEGDQQLAGAVGREGRRGDRRRGRRFVGEHVDVERRGAVADGHGDVRRRRDVAGGVAAGLFTVTVTGADVVVLADGSRTTAVSVWLPLPIVVEFQLIVYGAAVSSAPRLAPSSLNCTPTTLTLSAAVAETATVPFTV